MGRLINTSDLNNQIMRSKHRFGSLSVAICNIFDDMINHTPTARIDKPKGKWIPISYDGYADGNPVYDCWECSNCGYEHIGEDDTLTAYCPDCGSCMIEIQ